MRLDQLLAPILGPDSPQIPSDVEARGLAFDSRLVKRGDVFFAVNGVKVDGHAFVGDAATRGAVALVVEREIAAGGRVTVRVPSVRRAIGLCADRFFGEPSRDVATVAVTGTNGKTTTTFLMRAILDAAGLAPSLLGTIANEVGAKRGPSSATTPDALSVHRALHETREAGGRALVMEASSHALDQDRLAGVRVRGAIFTNLARDHLDYHGDPERYLAAKRKLFESLEPSAFAAVNARDRACEDMARATRARVVRYGGAPWCDVRSRILRSDLSGSRVVLFFEKRTARLELRLVGRHNVENALAAAAAAWAMGIPIETIVRGLESVRRVPGRLERVHVLRPHGPRVLVDYAHTPEALERVLDGLRRIARGRLVVVFGCGGDRDRGKRPLMGAAVDRHSDYAIVTSDNPRSEDPHAIIDEVVAGFRSRAFRVEPDRRAAIVDAVRGAWDDDVLVIAGKGHETGQIVGARTLPFNDAAVAREALLLRTAAYARPSRRR